MTFKMNQEKLIYMRLDYNEAVKSKKDILSSEATILNLIRTMKQYSPLRIEELKIKSRMHSKIKEIILNIKRLETTLPKIKIPSILKKYQSEELEEIEEKIEQTKIKQYDSSIESQLQDIQDKLRELAR